MIIIDRRQAIPPCLDAGWIAEPIEIPWAELVAVDAAERELWNRWVERLPAGVEVWKIDQQMQPVVRIKHRRPSITMLDAWHDPR